MPRKTRPFKIDGAGHPCAPVGTWANYAGIGLGEDALKRKMAAVGHEWEGRDSYVPLTVVLKALKVADLEAAAALKQARADEVQLKLTERRAKLGELMPRDEVRQMFTEALGAVVLKLQQLPADLAPRLNDPDAREVIETCIQSELLPRLQECLGNHEDTKGTKAADQVSSPANGE